MYPVSAGDDGVKIRPDDMEKEKLYHCVFKDKVMLFYKDVQDNLNCYEIEEKEIVEQVKSSSNNEDVEKIFQEYIEKQDLKN